jgi:RNA polymerase sigma factor for flagellar operon FliA
MGSVLQPISPKVSPRERHVPCIPNSVADGKPYVRPGRRSKGQRKPPAREWIGTFAEELQSPADESGAMAAISSREDSLSLLEIPAMTAARRAAQVSFQTLTQTMESNDLLAASLPSQALPDQDRFAQRDRVVLEHLPLVRAIAVRVHDNLPVHVDLDDLIHAGIMGLFDAATKFDTDKNVAFSSYAKHRIKGAILDSLRQLDWASRDLRRRHKQVEAITRDLAAELHRNPTEDEIATKMGVEVDRWRQMMIDLRNVGLISASTRTNESDDLPAPDFPTSPDYHPDSICAREELKSLLRTALSTLPERYQRVVLLYYANELTMKEIGAMLGINESRVSQIHKAALEKMANALGQAGISSAAAF